MINKITYLIDPEENSIRSFIKGQSEKIPNGSLVLDAGAGAKPYAAFFKHTVYNSTDFGDIFDKKFAGVHDFICDLTSIPKPDCYYDVIINTQVLEHVKYPIMVLKEFFRLLKPGGKVLLTVPQGWGVHGEPYHFFNFTKYGIQLLAADAGLKVQYINERGGIFKYLSKRIMTLSPYIYNQYRTFLKKRHLFMLSLPFYGVLKILTGILIPVVLMSFDKLDKKRDYTLGYECVLVKSI
jgi:SAM-dependent methyltransferase